MSSHERAVHRGQLWASKDGKRRVRIVRYDQRFDDALYLNLTTGRRGAIFGQYLRRRYDLIADVDLEANA